MRDIEPQEYEGLSCFFKVTRSNKNFNVKERNGIKTQKKERFEGNSIKFDGKVVLKTTE